MKSKATDLIVIAIAKAKSGKQGELEKALREVTGATREQPGCVQFSLLRPTGDRSTLVGFERWASAADHQHHLQGAHVQRLMIRLADILAEPPCIVSYEVVDG